MKARKICGYAKFNLRSGNSAEIVVALLTVEVSRDVIILSIKFVQVQAVSHGFRCRCSSVVIGFFLLLSFVLISESWFGDEP